MANTLELLLLGLSKAMESGVAAAQRRQERDQELALRQQQMGATQSYREIQAALAERRAAQTEEYHRQLNEREGNRLEQRKQEAAARQSYQQNALGLREDELLFREEQAEQRGALDAERFAETKRRNQELQDNAERRLDQTDRSLDLRANKPPSTAAMPPAVEHFLNLARQQGATNPDQLTEFARKTYGDVGANPPTPPNPDDFDQNDANWFSKYQRATEAFQQKRQTYSEARRVMNYIERQRAAPQQPSGQQPGQGQQKGASLDPRLFEGMPQGPGTTPGDRKYLGTMASAYNIVLGLTPAATLDEYVQAWSWWASQTPVAKMPMAVEQMAQGIPT